MQAGGRHNASGYVYIYLYITVLLLVSNHTHGLLTNYLNKHKISLRCTLIESTTAIDSLHTSQILRHSHLCPG
jgi:hypothetical protein